MNQIKSIYKLSLGLLILVVCAAAWPLCARAQETREPLTRPEVVRLLQNGVSPDRVGALAKQYGIAFQMTGDSEKEFRDAGANDDLIGMLRALAPVAARPPAVQPPKEEPAKPPEEAAPKTYLLKEGTEVKLKFAQDLSSKTATEGDPVNFSVDQDVTIGDTVVVRSGANAVGEVSRAERAGHMGKGGQLSVRLNYMKAGETRVRLRGTKGKEGEGKTGTAVALTVLFGPLGLLKHGKQVEVKAGSPLTAYVDEDVSLPAAR
jgi:hypothetical protein